MALSMFHVVILACFVVATTAQADCGPGFKKGPCRDVNSSLLGWSNLRVNQTSGSLLTVLTNTSEYFHVPSGICFEEVPTASLVKHQGNIPAGNGSSPSMSRIQVCCKGFERNVHNFMKCDPVCNPECVNAKCVGPNQCQCFPDHIRDLGGNCIATCPIGCLNGGCVTDGECVCNSGGYVLHPNKKFCVPTCTGGCIHGNCTAPNVCECNAGFKMDAATKKCGYICTHCDNGDCVGPEQCTCHTGYVKKEGSCQPVCLKGCLNGICIAPNVCSCGKGYALDATQTSCTFHCTQQCLNADCTAPDTCTCRRGYTKDPADTTSARCIAHCPTGCPNGVCSAPNFCICNSGFVKDRSLKGSQTCVRRERR